MNDLVSTCSRISVKYIVWILTSFVARRDAARKIAKSEFKDQIDYYDLTFASKTPSYKSTQDHQKCQLNP